MSIRRRAVQVLELQLDKCANTFGVSPCTATGVPCFNKRAGCKDPANFVRTEGGQTLRFVSRGYQAPLSLPLRPYLISIDTAPTEIRPGVGLAIRGQQKIVLADEPDNDTELDPYVNTRGAIATYFLDWSDGGTAQQTVVGGTGTTQSVVSGKYRLHQDALVVGVSRFDAIAAHDAATIRLRMPVSSIGDAAGNASVIFCSTYWGTPTAQSYGYEVQLRNTQLLLVKGSNLPLAPFADILASYSHGLSGGTWCDLEIEYSTDPITLAKRIRVFLNGTLRIDYTDPATGGVRSPPWYTGQVGLRVFSSSSLDWDFDDFSIAFPTSTASATFWRRLIARDPYMVGRMAKVYRGFEPNSGTLTLGDLEAELFVIDKVTGPDENGRVTVVLSDVLKLADKALEPLPTDGKLLVDVAGSAFTGAIVSATSTTVTLTDDASAVDDAYNGFEVLVLTGVGAGAGNRRAIADYVGATRTATLVGTWSVTPIAGSTCEVSPLAITLNGGKGAQYRDPALTGDAEYVRVGDEVIRYTAKSGDVLSWADGSYRAQFGTTRADHKANDKVQQCTIFDDWAASDVVIYLLRKASIQDALIDLVGLAAEDEEWLGTFARITAQLTAPEKIGEHLKALTYALNLMLWWDPIAQKVKGKVNAPSLEGASASIDDGRLISGGTRLDRLDDDRVTRVAINFAPRSATANLAEPKNFLMGKMRVNGDAEDENAYGPAGVRVEQHSTRWLSERNEVFAEAITARRLSWLSDAPQRLKARLDPADVVELAELVDVQTRRIVDQFGAIATVRFRVVKLDQKLYEREIELLSTNFGGRRWAFIAPAGQPDYSAASAAQRAYAYICRTTGDFASGDPGYLII